MLSHRKLSDFQSLLDQNSPSHTNAQRRGSDRQQSSSWSIKPQDTAIDCQHQPRLKWPHVSRDFFWKNFPCIEMQLKRKETSLINYTHIQLAAKSTCQVCQLSRYVNPSFHSNHSRRNRNASHKQLKMKLVAPIEKVEKTFPWGLSKPLEPQLPPWTHKVEPDSLGQWMTDDANCLHRAILHHPTYTKFTSD